MKKETNSNMVVRGILLIIATAFTISIQDLVFKQFLSDLTLWQIFTLRGMIALPILLTIGLLHVDIPVLLRTTFAPWPLARAMCITFTLLAFYAAIPFVELSTLGAVNYMAPIFVALLAVYILDEKLSTFGWVGVILGFIGVIILLQPKHNTFSIFALLPVLGALSYAIAHLITRIHCQNISLEALSLSQNLIMLIAGALVSFSLITFQIPENLSQNYPYLFGQWSFVDRKDWFFLIILAGFAVSIGMLLAAAYQSASPAIIATFEYSYIGFVVIWDILFFCAALSLSSILGITFIILAGWLVIKRS